MNVTFVLDTTVHKQTNSVNMTSAVLQTICSKDEPSIVFTCIWLYSPNFIFYEILPSLDNMHKIQHF